MSDPQVEKWKQTGSVYCWRYRDNARNYPGWNIAADKEGCAGFLSLLDLMEAAPYSSSKTIRLTAPTDDVLSVPNNRLGEARWTAVRSLSLRYPKGKVDPDHWELERDGERLTLSIGEAKLRELQSGLEDMMAGEGDWGIGESDEEILRRSPAEILAWMRSQQVLVLVDSFLDDLEWTVAVDPDST